MRVWFGNIIHCLWVNGCSVLHNSDAIHRLQGLPLLRDAIAAEYNRGIGDMPHSWYISYFYTPLYILLKQSPHHLQGWFLFAQGANAIIWKTPKTYSSLTQPNKPGLVSLLWNNQYPCITLVHPLPPISVEL